MTGDKSGLAVSFTLSLGKGGRGGGSVPINVCKITAYMAFLLAWTCNKVLNAVSPARCECINQRRTNTKVYKADSANAVM